MCAQAPPRSLPDVDLVGTAFAPIFFSCPELNAMSKARRNLAPTVPAEPTDQELDSEPIGLLRAPVNADVQSIDVACVSENDTLFYPLGARGIGEIGITGVAGALANAVFHATGKRIRSLPITLDKLL